MRSISSTITFLFMFSVATVFAQPEPVPIHWRIAAELPSNNDVAHPGIAGAVTGVLGDVMLVAGGANFPEKMPWDGGAKKYHDQAYLYDQTFALRKGSYHLPENIAYAANCATTKGLLYAGGENENGISSKVYLLNWNNKSLSFLSLPDLPVALTNASAVSIGDHVFVIGGEMKIGVSDQIWCLDLRNTSSHWKKITTLPKPVSHAVVVAVGKQIFILGGRKKNANAISTFYDDVNAFDVERNVWTHRTPLPYGLSAGTGIAKGNKIFLFGGDKGIVFGKVETLLLAIASESNALKKEALIKEKNALQIDHPGFSKEIIVYDVIKEKTEVISVLPYPTPVTTTAFWWKDQLIIPSGEVKAGVRSPHILAGKL